MTQISTVPNCCKKLTVVRSIWPWRVIEACTAARRMRENSSAMNTKITK
jgi:hypothetical protein